MVQYCIILHSECAQNELMKCSVAKLSPCKQYRPMWLGLVIPSMLEMYRN